MCVCVARVVCFVCIYIYICARAYGKIPSIRWLRGCKCGSYNNYVLRSPAASSPTHTQSPQTCTHVILVYTVCIRVICFVRFMNVSSPTILAGLGIDNKQQHMLTFRRSGGKMSKLKMIYMCAVRAMKAENECRLKIGCARHERLCAIY